MPKIPQYTPLAKYLFMKIYLLIFFLLIIPFSLLAQTQKQIYSWLYGLPIQKKAKTIRKFLQSDNRFCEKTPVRTFEHSNLTFYGKILKPNLPTEKNIDSSSIRLFFGNVQNKDEYSGDITILLLEYFSKDTLLIQELFDAAEQDLNDGSIKQKPTGFRTKNSNAVGKGTDFIYINSSKVLSKITTEKVKYSDGNFSFQILYVCSAK